MRTRPTLLLLALVPALLFASGCGGHRDPVEPGDLTLLWSFDGVDCDLAGVTAIEVDLQGLSAPDHDTRTVSCDLFYEGIHLYDLAEGSYRLTLRGLDRNGRLLYDLVTEVEVVAWTETPYTLDLPSRTGSLDVWWDTLGVSCFDAVVSEVEVFLYDDTGEVYAGTFDCTSGGVVWDVLDPGIYEVFLQAYDPTNILMGSTDFTVEVTRGTAQQVDAALLSAASNLEFYWTFDGDPTCYQGEEVHVTLVSPFEQVLIDEGVSCSQAKVTLDGVPPGTWTVWLEMTDASGYQWALGPEFLEVAEGADEVYYLDLQ